MRIKSPKSRVDAGTESFGDQETSSTTTTTTTATLKLKYRPMLVWGTLILLIYLPFFEILNNSLLPGHLNNVQSQTEEDVSDSNDKSSGDGDDDNNNNVQQYDEDGFPLGVLSQKPKSFFQSIRDRIDDYDLQDRCQRYGFGMSSPNNETTKLPRRIFYGSLIAEEPWELFDIVSTEVHGIFAGMVFVESNRTQNFYARPFKRANDKHTTKLKEMFGTPQLEIRRFVNEDPSLIDLAREQAQRDEIVGGWKEMGMTAQDIGYIADADESFSRDFLRAVQYCPYVEALDYNSHHCFNVKAKIVGSTRVFETSPECVTKQRAWFHPDMIIGACVEGIADPVLNPSAKRSGFHRAKGYGRDCDPSKWELSYGKIEGDRHPPFSPCDFRSQCGGHMYEQKSSKTSDHARYSAFHMHNFFAKFESTRHKYLTYGHPKKTAMVDRLEDIDQDLKLAVRCVLSQTDGYNYAEHPDRQTNQRVVGGLNAGRPPWPIYFRDADYRRRKHRLIKKLVLEDERKRQERLNLTKPELELLSLEEELKEARRVIWDREAKMEALRKKHSLPS